MADLGSKATEKTSSGVDNETGASAMTEESEPAAALPPPSDTAESPVQQTVTQELVIAHKSEVVNLIDYLSTLCFQSEPQTKADKIKLALEKLKEAKVRKVKSGRFLCVFLHHAAAHSKVTPSLLPLLADSKGADE